MECHSSEWICLPAFDEYLTDAFGREAIEFVERHKNEPFCLYLAFNAVHGPMQATNKIWSGSPTSKTGADARAWR